MIPEAMVNNSKSEKIRDTLPLKIWKRGKDLGSRLPGTRPEFLDFPENRQGKEQVVFSGEGQRDPKISLALEQPRLAPVQPWGCSRARDNFGTLRPRPKKTTCSLSIFREKQEFGPCTRQSGSQEKTLTPTVAALLS